MNKIREFREKAGLSQRTLGELCGFTPKSAQQRISAYESGVKQPPIRVAQRILLEINKNIRFKKDQATFEELFLTGE